MQSGNRFLRNLKRTANVVTSLHTVVFLSYILSAGAASVGESLTRRGGPLDHMLRNRNLQGRARWFVRHITLFAFNTMTKCVKPLSDLAC